MAYAFASGNRVEFAITPFVGATFGPVTVAWFMKANVIGTQLGPSIQDSGGTGKLYLLGFTGGTEALRSSAVDSTLQIPDTTTWCLVAFTAANGTVAPRFHFHNGTSWTHATPGGTFPNVGPIASGDKMYVGSTSANVLRASVACAGIKKADSTDGQIETLSRTSFQTWRDFGFDWLIGFDSSLESGGILQDQGTIGTGDEIGITGTSVVADPPSWVWAPPAVTPVANFTGTPLTGTEPFVVAFTDTSTNTPTSWAWTFGDGGTSSSQNPSHTYTTAGTYTVALTATNSAGSNTKTRTGYIVVADQPRPIRINTSQGWMDIADATSLVSGTGPPTAAIGATGGIYLDTTSGKVYGPKAGGAWPATAIGKLLLPGNTYADVLASYTNYAGLLAG